MNTVSWQLKAQYMFYVQESGLCYIVKKKENVLHRFILPPICTFR